MDRLVLIRSATWAALVGATICSAWAVSHLSNQAALVGTIMALAAGKAVLVLRNFMDLGKLPAPLRWLFTGWAASCAVLIFTFAALS